MTVTVVSGSLRNDLKNDILLSISDLTKVYYNWLRQDIEALRSGDVILECRAEQTKKKLPYSTALSQWPIKVSTNNVFKAIITPKSSDMSGDKVRDVIKKNINPSEINVGISIFKTISKSNILIESNKKEDIDRLCCSIIEKCVSELQAEPCKTFLPRMIIYNIPDEI